MKIETLIKKLLESAPCEWQAIIEKHVPKMPIEQQQRLSGAMEGIAGRLAYLAGYVDHRTGNGGFWEGGHKSAAATAKTKCIKVNRAMGYTYAERRAFNL